MWGVERKGGEGRGVKGEGKESVFSFLLI